MRNKKVTSNSKLLEGLAFLKKQNQNSLQKIHISGFNQASVIQNLILMAQGSFYMLSSC